MFGINKLKKENKLLKGSNEALKSELSFSKHTLAEALRKLTDIKKENFSLKNILIEKDNELSLLRAVKKAEKFSDNEKYY